MEYRKLTIVGYYFKVYLFETTEELRDFLGEELPVNGMCWQRRGKKYLGDLYLALDGSVGTSVHELYHAVAHLYKSHGKDLGIFRDGKRLWKESKEEIIASLMGDGMNELIKIISDGPTAPKK